MNSKDSSGNIAFTMYVSLSSLWALAVVESLIPLSLQRLMPIRVLTFCFFV